MSFYSNSNTNPIESSVPSISMASIMRLVYMWMALGLGVTAAVSYYVYRSGLWIQIFSSPMITIVMLFMWVFIVFGVQRVIMNSSIAVGTICYLAITGYLGVIISGIFAVYTANNIAYSFLATSATFAAMSFIGFTTKMDLSRFGNLLWTVFIGLVIASIVNLFFYSELLYWLVSYVGVILFTALIAYDTQWIKNFAGRASMGAVSQSSNGEAVMDTVVQRVALIGAFHLYLDFVNLFLFILRLGGRRR